MTDGDGAVTPDEDPWARYLVEAGIVIEDQKELRLANLALSRAQFLKCMDADDPPTTQQLRARLLVAIAVAAILESNGQYKDMRDGAARPIDSVGPGHFTLQVNNRYFSIPHGAFPIHDALRAQRRATARPLDAPKDWTAPPYRRLNEDEIQSVLVLANEALGWLVE